MYVNIAFMYHASVEKFTERHCNTTRLPISEMFVKNLILQ